MFGHKNNKISLVLLIFGFIAFAIIIAVGFLIINISKNGLKHSQSGFSNARNFVQEVKNFDVEQNYQSQMIALKDKISSLASVDAVYQNVEDVFFNVRVPEEKREAHLQALIKINQLKDSGEKSVEVVREKVMELVSQLVNSN